MGKKRVCFNCHKPNDKRSKYCSSCEKTHKRHKSEVMRQEAVLMQRGWLPRQLAPTFPIIQLFVQDERESCFTSSNIKFSDQTASSSQS